IKALTEKINKDKEQKQEVSTALEKVNQEIEEYEGKQAKQQELLAKLEELRDTLSQKMVEVVREKERTEASLNLIDEKARHREVIIDEKETSIKQINTRNEKLKEELEQVVAVYKEKDAEFKAISKTIKQLEEKRKYLEGDKETQMEELRSHYIEL